MATYLLQATTNVEDSSSWKTIATVSTGLDATFSYIDTDSPNYTYRFYRLATP